MVVRVQSLLSPLAAVALCLAPAASSARSATASSSNPVIDADFPDPAALKAPDGFYYAYATQTERNGKWINLQVARSKDLKRWRLLGDALPTKPHWASKTQDFWAPHVLRDGGRYIMYYSAKPDTADERHGLCLAVATATRPEGPFTDMGHPLQCGESFVNIDPMAFDDPATGKKLLYWGSGFKPIKVQELKANRMAFAPGTTPKDLIGPNPAKDQFPVLVEGPWVLRHGPWYYMFYSGDNCCGAKANYAVMVARSKSATGPFETLQHAKGTPHSIILSKRGKWIAPGHNSVATDARGNSWILYHAVDVGRPRTKPTDEVNTRRVMLVDRIEWRNGWPTVRGN
ncbi:glycoside hydrolase family 43 protein [Sphingomonas sp. SM33]|uniref:Glycoside hydrolase family 43 protein n=1 Tax=Sphingomonas telluris TaxID=2907998 RepID=A0ABS9VQK0_9SPHN|nr:glycoside hydrolase family 43 protein [Sphingomonas telluris]MCH8617256.1 glycoside hydrolase family 43 protein [Sphingomonas telluris]